MGRALMLSLVAFHGPAEGTKSSSTAASTRSKQKRFPSHLKRPVPRLRVCQVRTARMITGDPS